MKYLINDKGRECTCCGEFKEWGDFGNHKKGTRGKKSLCLRCSNELNYVDKHGCLKEDNIDPKHYDADKIIDKYRGEVYKSKLLELKSTFGRKNTRYCQLCSKLKVVDKYSSYEKKSKHSNGRAKVCDDCKIIKQDMKKCPIHETLLRERNDRYVVRKFCGVCEYEKQKDLKTKKIQEAIRLADSKLNVDNGFIYLYRCEELDCFKIGRTVDDPREYVKVKSSSSNGNYGIKLDLVAYIVSPIRDCDAEWLATRSIKHKMVEYTKPCGGQARELFRCGLYEALLILRSISDKMYIEPNPFVSLDDLGAIEINVHVPSKAERSKMKRADGVVARKILRGVRNSKPWNVVMDEYTSTCVCRSTKHERGVHIRKDDLSSSVRFCGKHLYLGKHGDDKFLIITKFKSVFDLRDKLFINGRYIEGAEKLLKDEIKRVRSI